eukprot:gnl/MRDRNA2_/MRDRNA2_89244_c0_seq1.p1 gnl/MRDRNA2_/MRDRNA2_89244_c0~~gnl/MRDRNA2_/MRDRNA2_89244_c0_seq1.p1  ORF type:complete len:309 (-),score=56.35 gnl/MRDRNA2_/MRDRNA2_89244_c0_seq1:236-1105(-)
MAVVAMGDETMVPSWASSADPSQFTVVDYEATLQQADPTAAPEKQAKIALDSAIASGNIDQVHLVLNQVGQMIPQHSIPLMMHAMRSAAKQGSLAVMQFLLEQIGSCHPTQVFDLMKYALDGAAVQDEMAMMTFLLGKVQEAFHAYPQQFVELVQHAVNTAAKHGNLRLLKFLMEHASQAAIPVNYDTAFNQAVTAGQGEPLLKDAIIGGAPYESVTLMLLQAAKSLPENNDSQLGSRQSMKNTAKLQIVRSYKQKDPELFSRLMAAIKSYFPEELVSSQRLTDGDIAM